MKDVIALMKKVVGALAAVLGIGALVRTVHSVRKGQLMEVWNVANAAVGTHEGTVTRKAGVAITAKHLLGKLGNAGEQYVEVAGVNDVPLYVMPDEAALGDAVACEILGVAGSTVRMLASAGIAAGSEVVPAANGKVRALPAAAGTYSVVGRALTASEADGDLVEVASCVARRVTVT